MKYIITTEGIGDRLWPLNGMITRKILRKENKGKTLLQTTYETISELAKPKDIITIANITEASEVKKELEQISEKPIIITEPMIKQNGITIYSGIKYIEGKRDEVVIIIPAVFGTEEKKELAALTGELIKTAKKGLIAGIGVKPLYAETSIDYIKVKNSSKEYKNLEKYIMQPSLQDAENFIKSKDYYWNTGIYAAKVSVLNEMFIRHALEVSKNITKDIFNNKNQIRYEIYEKTKDITIESILEKEPERTVIYELKSRRKDYFTWNNIYKNGEKDRDKNVTYGNVIINNVKNSIIYSSKELVSVTDSEGIIVAETEDAVLVSDRNRINETGKLIRKINEKDETILKNHRTVSRPWGYYTCLNRGEGWLTKIITVMPGHKLSLQSHNYRSEHWVILSGNANVKSDGKVYNLTKGQSIDIPVKSKHSLMNAGSDLLKILEVQKGEKISEEDIIRYEDMYGRV